MTKLIGPPVTRVRWFLQTVFLRPLSLGPALKRDFVLSFVYEWTRFHWQSSFWVLERRRRQRPLQPHGNRSSLTWNLTIHTSVCSPSSCSSSSHCSHCLFSSSSSSSHRGLCFINTSTYDAWSLSRRSFLIQLPLSPLSHASSSSSCQVTRREPEHGLDREEEESTEDCDGRTRYAAL